MTKKEFDILLDAQNKLCGFCEVNECEKCIVTHLIDDAYNELADTEEEDND